MQQDRKKEKCDQNGEPNDDWECIEDDKVFANNPWFVSQKCHLFNCERIGVVGKLRSINSVDQVTKCKFNCLKHLKRKLKTKTKWNTIELDCTTIQLFQSLCCLRKFRNQDGNQLSRIWIETILTTNSMSLDPLMRASLWSFYSDDHSHNHKVNSVNKET